MASSLSNRAAAGERAERTARWGGWLPLAACVALLLLVSGLPYLYGHLTAPRGLVFQGIAFNVADIVQYWSWMRDHRGALVVPNRMTSEPNDPALFNMLWLILGQVQNLTGWRPATIYQALRLAGGAAFLLVLWWFVGLFLRDTRARWAAYLTAGLGGGLGWIWVVEKYAFGLSDVRFPLDVYVVEPNAFFALIALPHLLVAAAMIMAIFGLFLRAEQQGDDPRRYGAAALLALLLGLSHTYDLIMVYGILGVYVLLQFVRARRVLWGRFWGLGAVGLISSPPAAYFTYLTSLNPLWNEVLAQFDNAGIFTPNLLHIPILLGLPFLATLFCGARLLARRRASPSPAAPEPAAGLAHRDFLWVWVVVGFGLLYIPTDFQIKMLNPYQVPLALIAVGALAGWATNEQPAAAAQKQHGRTGARRWALVWLFVLATLPTSAYLLGWRVLELSRHDAPFYLSDDDMAALRWLDDRSDERAVVLSGLTFGQYVPALTGQRAFLAHWAQTARFFNRRDDVRRFFDASTPADERRALLDSHTVRYVVRGTEERTLGTFDPTGDPQLRQVFASGQVQVFEVLP
ncbi:MAG TPA: hypothetical protein VFS21_39440 [Roseiflexaceae bacterium]|nr:hypothetical protein [Roseiflexaceae bacterium]